MSRAFNPPDTLTKEEIRTIADVRRDIWTNGIRGLAFGSVTGYTLHKSAQVLQSRSIVIPKSTVLNKNSAFLAFMIGGALGSFAFATAAGKNNVHQLHGVIESNKQKGQIPGNGTMYQQMRERALRLEEEELREQEKVAQMQERKERKLLRRQTLHQRLADGVILDENGKPTR